MSAHAMNGGFKLRDYQREAVAEAERRNLLVVLPTNSGKTVIAAELILHTLLREETKARTARIRKEVGVKRWRS